MGTQAEGFSIHDAIMEHEADLAGDLDQSQNNNRGGSGGQGAGGGEGGEGSAAATASSSQEASSSDASSSSSSSKVDLAMPPPMRRQVRAPRTLIYTLKKKHASDTKYVSMFL